MSNPNTSLNKTSNRSDDIDKEVSLLMKKNADKQRSTYTILEDLKLKFKDDEIVESIIRKYNDKMKRVRKIAEKIKDRLLAKYPNLSMREYIEKITEYKKKYNFDDSEMQSIINLIFLNRQTIANPEALDANYNEMSKALGFIPASYNMGGKLHVKKDELDIVQMIVAIASATRELHNQVTIQSLIYSDCDQVALQLLGFDKTKINIFSFIHPVVAALFLPKFKLLDQHLLLASIAEILTYKTNGQELQTQPEYELYWDISTDPAESACANKTKPFTDLANRCNVQTKLWEAVLNLRQGKYYLNDLGQFLMAIDNCKSNVFDAADLAYVKDEGTVMRKLLSAFSIRPTIVVTTPIYEITPMTSHISPVTSSQITTLSMITMRIPMTLGKTVDPIDLREALTQRQLYIHHRQLTAKQQDILYSRELLIFYVHRRYQTINTARLTAPYYVSYLPTTINHFERLHDVQVTFPYDDLIIGRPSAQQTFRIRSVVSVDAKEIKGDTKNKIIVGCKSYIFPEDSNTFDKTEYCAYKYEPLKLEDAGKEVFPLQPYNKDGYDEVIEEISKTGTLFVYATKDSNSNIFG